MRTTIVALTALAVSACYTITPNGYENESNRNANNLIKYTEEILDQYGTHLADDLIFMLTLDEYMKLTPEEQADIRWANFRSNLEHYTESYMNVPSKGLKIDTRGESLTEEGTSWIYEVASYYSYAGYNGYNPRILEDGDEVPGHSNFRRITCIAENQYEIIDEKGKDIMYLTLEAIPSPYGGYDFTGSGSGKILANNRGLSADYSILELYYRKYRVDEDGTGSSSVTVSYEAESLDIRVYTYHNGEALDWCELIKTADSEIEYRGNLEYIEDRLYYE